MTAIVRDYQAVSRRGHCAVTATERAQARSPVRGSGGVR